VPLRSAGFIDGISNAGAGAPVGPARACARVATGERHGRAEASRTHAASALSGATARAALAHT